MGGSGNRRGFYEDTRPTRAQEKNPPKGRSSTGSGGLVVGDACDISTAGTLRSPPPHVAGKLKVGDDLAVVSSKISGVDVLQAVHATLGAAGAIDCPEEQALIECIAGGNSYSATIRRIQGGAIVVYIARVGEP